MQAATVIEFPVMDRNRFTDLIRGHHLGLVAYATALVKSEAAARDLVQDSCVAAWQSLEKFDVSRDFGTWMRGIVRNKWREHCRKYKREVALDEETLSRLEQPFEVSSEDADLFARLAECRSKLPEPMAEVVRVIYDEGRTSDEAAEILETKAPALRKRLERAREALRLCLSRSN
ncbi:RNA polymerase sigma factor [Haloferula sp.]|uniref:RNA polymerase sigma factor n=1 Tax=Haloferula sp. TaxID=2497595 RepID=UPI003C759067